VPAVLDSPPDNHVTIRRSSINDDVELVSPKIPNELLNARPIDEAETVLACVREHSTSTTAEVRVGTKLNRDRVREALDYLATRDDVVDFPSGRVHHWTASRAGS